MGFSEEKQPVHLSIWIIESTDVRRLAHKCVQQCLKKGSVVVWPGRRLHLRLYNYTSALESVCFDSGSIFSLCCCCDSREPVDLCWRKHHIIQSEAGSRRFWSHSTYTSPALWIPTNQLNPQPITPPPNFSKCPQLYQGPLKGARVSASQNKESYYTFRSNSGTPPHLKVHQSFNRGLWFCKDWGFCNVTIYFEIILHFEIKFPPNGNL